MDIHTKVYVRKDTCAARYEEIAKQIDLDKRKPSGVETDLNKGGRREIRWHGRKHKSKNERNRGRRDRGATLRHGEEGIKKKKIKIFKGIEDKPSGLTKLTSAPADFFFLIASPVSMLLASASDNRGKNTGSLWTKVSNFTLLPLQGRVRNLWSLLTGPLVKHRNEIYQAIKKCVAPTKCHAFILRDEAQPSSVFLVLLMVAILTPSCNKYLKIAGDFKIIHFHIQQYLAESNCTELQILVPKYKHVQVFLGAEQRRLCQSL